MHPQKTHFKACFANKVKSFPQPIQQSQCHAWQTEFIFINCAFSIQAGMAERLRHKAKGKRWVAIETKRNQRKRKWTTNTSQPKEKKVKQSKQIIHKKYVWNGLPKKKKKKKKGHSSYTLFTRMWARVRIPLPANFFFSITEFHIQTGLGYE